jgi:hypothetical protein
MNPFKAWKDRFFDRQQLDYLFYWREVACEIEEERQREIFWSAVYHIISYWLSNRRLSFACEMLPDQLMNYVLDLHKKIAAGRENTMLISNTAFEDLQAVPSSLTVFPILFSEEENCENELQAIFHAWFHGHADIDKARKDIRIVLRKYLFALGENQDLELFVRLAEKSDIAAVCWSGTDLPPRLYEQEMVEKFRTAFSKKFINSRLLLKAVDRSADAYDYLLLFSG